MYYMFIHWFTMCYIILLYCIIQKDGYIRVNVILIIQQIVIISWFYISYAARTL